MKKITVLFLCVFSLYAGAQNIKLNIGSKITGNTNTTMEMDMGMGGQMKITSTSTHILNITGSDDKNYIAANSITKIQVSQEGIGSSMTFDSDKKEDLESEAGKAFPQINTPVTVTIDKFTGSTKELNPEKSDENEEDPVNGLMEGMIKFKSNISDLVKTAFFIIPAGKKTGDKWADSATTDGLKNINNFELVSINNNIAVINIKTTAAGTISKETQGMQMEVTINRSIAETVEIDTNTSLVKKRISAAETNGTLEMMGQSLPVSAKVNTTTVFE